MPPRKGDEGHARRIEEARAEIDLLRDAVLRLAASMMWERGGAATAVAKPVVEARPPEFAKMSASTESVCAGSPGEAGFSWSRAGGMVSASDTEVVKSVGEARPLGFAGCSGTAGPESELAESCEEKSAFSAQSKCCDQRRRNSSRKVCW